MGRGVGRAVEQVERRARRVVDHARRDVEQQGVTRRRPSDVARA